MMRIWRPHFANMPWYAEPRWREKSDLGRTPPNSVFQIFREEPDTLAHPTPRENIPVSPPINPASNTNKLVHPCNLAQPVGSPGKQAREACGSLGPLSTPRRAEDD